MPQSPVSIIFGYDATTPSSTYNGRMMQPVLVSPIPENAHDFEGVTVLRGQPVLQNGAGASVAPFAEGIQGTVQVARGPGIEPVIDFFDGPDWFRYLDALDREGHLDEVFMSVAAGNQLMDALAARAPGVLRLEGPAQTDCWIIAPGERYGMGDKVLVSDIRDPNGYYEDGRVEPEPFWVYRHANTTNHRTTSWVGTDRLDLPNWPDDEDRGDFKDYLRSLGRAVLIEGKPLDDSLRLLEHSLRDAYPHSMMPRP
ncbi:MAG: hypothetical protein ACREPQ_00625 [Rhodanobacter sp.]